MFNCTVCAHTPFGKLFGFKDSSVNPDKNKTDNNSPRKRISAAKSDISDMSAASKNVKKGIYTPRTEAETKELLHEWLDYIDPRASSAWNQMQIEDLLTQVITCIDRKEDPLNDDDEPCVKWYGEKSTSGTPIIFVDRFSNPQPYSVARVLVFLFADDETFNELATIMESEGRKNQPIANTCNNPLCIKLNHISLR